MVDTVILREMAKEMKHAVANALQAIYFIPDILAQNPEMQKVSQILQEEMQKISDITVQYRDDLFKLTEE